MKFDIVSFCCEMSNEEQREYLKEYWTPILKKYNKVKT